ncbi:MAG: apolipoprotein N-acyltransferase [Saprospirales bacterium]|nr:MAG: apolipoprotein N-acyltransferase [Saprospirales bacterium]
MKGAATMRWIVFAALLVTGLAAAWFMELRFNNDLLWGYRPLLCFMSIWLAIAVVLFPNPFKNQLGARYFWWPIFGGLLLAFSFPPTFLPVLAMAGFVPILLLSDPDLKLTNRFGPRAAVAFHTFMIWNITATFWVANTALIAGVFAIVVNSLLMLVPWVLFLLVRNRVGLFKAGIILLAFWLSFEFLHHRWELTWPWLTLGNALSGLPILAQWYEYTGTAGGSIWILGANWWLYKAIKRGMQGYHDSYRKLLMFRFLPWLLIPAVFSLYLYAQPGPEAEDTVKTAVIQPNFEPHYEKFDIPYSQQMDRILGLVRQSLEDGAEIVVLPETSVRVRLHEGLSDQSLAALATTMSEWPDAYLIAGLSSNYIFPSAEEADPAFLREHIRAPGDTIFWESHNSAAVINKDGLMDIYYKSKLVPGAEIFPFRRLLFFLEPIVNMLGGSTSGLRTQADRSAFLTEKYGLAPVICYESVFGEFHIGYFDAGARAIVIMTNDGWWDDTPGHIQHLYIGALRAIEFRKEIARSANTGISGFIDTKGRIRKPTAYEETAVVIDHLELNNHRTFYSRTGDYLSRIALLLSIGFFLLIPVETIRRKTKPR